MDFYIHVSCRLVVSGGTGGVCTGEEEAIHLVSFSVKLLSHVPSLPTASWMMAAQCSLTSNLALLVLLGTVQAGPFSPRSNVTLPAPRPPPQPGGRTEEPRRGSPSSQLYEHTVQGGEKQVVFTHRINLPPSSGCGCPPGTEPPVPASEVQALRIDQFENWLLNIVGSSHPWLRPVFPFIYLGIQIFSGFCQ